MRWDDRKGILQVAKEAGASRYFTGIACSRGHVAERYVSNRLCVECSNLRNRSLRTFSRQELQEERKRRLSAHFEAIEVASNNAHVVPEVISMTEAKRQGIQRYFTGKPCKRGHISVRYVKTRTCVECFRVRYKNDKFDQLSRSRERYASDPDRVKRRVKEYQAANKEKLALFRQNRRARMMMSGGSASPGDIAEIRKQQDGKCAYCRQPLKAGRATHIDHIVPIARGGGGDRSNIQLLCIKCNSRKGARDPIEFAQSLGRLL